MGNCVYSIKRKEALRRNLTITSQSKKKYMTEENRVASENVDEARPDLTDRQKELVVQSWSVMKEEMDGVGVHMFMKLFEQHPDVLEVFTPFQGLALDELPNNKQLRSHVHQVMATVDKCLQCIHDPATMERLLHDLGSRHAMYTAKVDYMDLIGPQFIPAVEAVCYEHWTPDMEHAWADLFKLIAHIMKTSMQF